MRYVLGAIGVIILAILAIVLLGRGGTPTNNGQQPGGKKAANLLDYANKPSSQVRWTMQGVINGEDQHRSVRVIVSQDERRVEILDGYEESVEKSQEFINTSAAYDTFLHALDLAGFNRTRKVTITDERGVCPLGNRFIYDLADGSDHPLHSWSASCASNLGPSAGNALLIRQLFQNQIPEYSKFTQGVKI